MFKKYLATIMLMVALFAGFSALGAGTVPASAHVVYDHTCNSSGSYLGVDALGLGLHR